VSTFGLDGILSWPQARLVAGSAARSLPPRPARLDEAGGNVLASPLATVQDDPPCDSAALDGFAVCGEGPWLLHHDLDVLTPATATPVEAGQPVPRHADAVLGIDAAATGQRPDGRVRCWRETR
jgi:molybdopterin molybdotransferase